MYESEQWTDIDCGHTPLTVDTQEWASREKALTVWYLSSVCESEQWTYTDRGHTLLTVDTQELASREKALTEWYLGSVCMKVNSGHMQTVDTHH